MKKVVNSALASALALSMAPAVVSAQETQQAPQMDAGLEKVVKRLEALGLVKGYGNGDYGVDRTITRAEFATLLVRAKNMEQAASMAKFQNNFKDVKPSDWFSGYVNVAFGDEIIKGYGDKTFRPNNQVTYAEAVTMIVRALGYQPAAEAKGSWPNNYIAEAAQLGISNGVQIDGSKPAVRGDIFKLLDNSLNIDMMEQVSFGTNVEYKPVEDKTLLSHFLNVQVYDMDWATKPVSGRDAEDLPFVKNVPVTGLGSLKLNEVEFGSKGGTSQLKGKFKVLDTIDPNQFAGQHVQVWVKDNNNSDDVVVWMEGSTSEDVVNDTIDTFYYDGKAISSLPSSFDLSKLSLKLGNGKKYDFADDANVVYNFKVVQNSDELKTALNDMISNGNTVKVVLNDQDEIVFIAAVDDITADNSKSALDNDVFGKFGSELLSGVNTSKNELQFVDDGNNSTNKYQLEGDEGKDFLVFLNGKPAKLADLQPKDVITIYNSNGDKDKKLVFATRQVVEGTVNGVRLNKSSDNRITIGDKEYRFRSGASYSEGDNKVEKITTDEIRSLDGEAVKAYLDAAGRIRHIETANNISDRNVRAILTRDVYFDGDMYSFKVLTEKGKELTVKLEKGDIKDWNGNELTDAQITSMLKLDDTTEKGKLVPMDVKFDANGNVKEVKLVDTSNLVELDDANWDKAADEDDLTFSYNNESYDEANGVVFDASGAVSSDARKELKDAGIKTFKSIADESNIHVFFMEEDNDVPYFYVTNGSIEDDSKYGYVTGIKERGGDTFVTVLTNDSDEFKEVEYKVDGDRDDAEAKFLPGDFIRFSVDSDNLVDPDNTVVIATTNFNNHIEESGYMMVKNAGANAKVDYVVPAKVEKVDSKKLTVQVWDSSQGKYVDKQYSVGSKTGYALYDETVLSEVEEGDYVLLIDTDDDGSNADYVLVAATNDEVDKGEVDEAALDQFLKQNYNGTGVSATSSEVTAGAAPTAGTAEVNKLTVGAGATAAGNIDVTFDDGSGPQTQTVAVNVGDSANQVASAIATAFSGLSGYTVTASGSDVVFTANAPAADKNVTITLTDTGTTGVGNANGTEVTAGVAPTAGTAEVNKLTVTAGAAAAGTNTVTFSDGTVTQSVTVNLNGSETAADVATKIAAAFNALNGGTGVAGYTIAASGADVTFTANAAAADKNVTITLN